MNELNKNAFNPKLKLRKVAIVLGFYEGYEFINKQLQSIFDQTHQNFIIFVSDDNSKNNFSIEKLNISERNKKKLELDLEIKILDMQKIF
jgi:hypothetical protein